ncbi:MAG: T9SS C-terminal target domain-containing protein [Cryomorphaceae bacterium]|nr:MAG: T9SS C-terminal target domain-containing protein [Cryomorphaceae bacterium]
MKKLLLTALAFVTISSAYSQCIPEYGKLVINEFMARNVVIPNEFDEFEDWVEIMNAGDEPIDIGGYFLSDKHGNRTRYTFPDMTLDPGDYVVVWCDGQPWLGEFHADFKLQGSLGEKVVLSNPDTIVIDHYTFGPVDNIQSLSRTPNGSGPFLYATPSPGAPNNPTDYSGASLTGRGLVVNEFLARNTDAGTDEFGNNFDWIEIYNNTSIVLNMGGYLLSDKSNNPGKYTFPEPTIVAPGGYVVVFASGIDGIDEIWPYHTTFSLSGSGEYVHLYNKDTVTLDYVKFGQQQQNISEGRFENGLGPITCLEPTMGFTNDPGTVSVQEFDVPEEFMFSIYPVPATDYINIQMTDWREGTIQVFSAIGSHVANYNYVGAGPHFIDVSGYTPGVYLVRIQNQTKRIVVK